MPDAQNSSGNGAKAGINKGDTIIYTSSFFGDELWPSDSLGSTRSALVAAPSPVCLVYVSHWPACTAGPQLLVIEQCFPAYSASQQYLHSSSLA